MCIAGSLCLICPTPFQRRHLICVTGSTTGASPVTLEPAIDLSALRLDNFLIVSTLADRVSDSCRTAPRRSTDVILDLLPDTSALPLSDRHKLVWQRDRAKLDTFAINMQRYSQTHAQNCILGPPYDYEGIVHFI